MIFRRVVGEDGRATWSVESLTGAVGPARIRVDQGRLYSRSLLGIFEWRTTWDGRWGWNTVVWDGVSALDGAANSNFDVDGDLIVDGVCGLSWGNGGTPGSVKVYRRNGTVWTLDATLPDRNPVNASYAWGTSVAVDGDTVAVGTGFPGPDQTPHYVRVFRRSSEGVWNLEADLNCPSAGAGAASFGQSLALSGDRLVVGMPLADTGGPGSGAVQVFQRDGQTWRPVASYAIKNSDGANIGWNVALSGDEIIGSGIGLPGGGGAAVFDACSLPANGDHTPRCLPGVTGLLAFLDAYFKDDGFADFNRSGAVSIQDVLDFLGAWIAGCP